MLKFLRKYQLILLAIGGSLLMVVFLLQPVLQNFGPNPGKQKVGEIGPTASKVTQAEVYDAYLELEVLRRFFSEEFVSDLLDLEEGREDEHWMLLKREAEAAGVIGESSEAQIWISEIASGAAQQQLNLMLRQGQIPSEEDQQEIIDRVTEQVTENRNRIMSGMRMQPEQFDAVLTTARGIDRLKSLYGRGPRLSDRVARVRFSDEAAAAVVDFVALTADQVVGEIPEPTEDELAFHVEAFRDVRPGDTEANEYGLGYLLPPRLKLEWLRLDQVAIGNAVKVDPIEVRKQWQRDNPGADRSQFDADRPQIEAVIRNRKAVEIADLADEIIRGELLKWSRGLEKDGVYRVLTDEAASSRPSYEDLAQLVVEQVKERAGVDMPLPIVERRAATWFTGPQLATLDGLGRANFRVGATTIRMTELPDYVRSIGELDTLPAQVGVPLIEPIAQDMLNNRYYVTILDARPESGPDGLDEVREQAVQNFKLVRAYEKLVTDQDLYRDIALADGLEAIGRFLMDPEDPDAVPSPALAVQEAQQIRRGGLFPEAFQDQLVEAALKLDPSAPADSIPEAEAYQAIPVPQARALVICKLRSLRPLTFEQYRGSVGRFVDSEIRQEVIDAVGEDSPFSFDALAARLGYVAVEDANES